jgi:RHS repeat-associated protein
VLIKQFNIIGTATNVDNANSFRYRGYYYDAETGFCYLNARYYNPQWRRFISPDDTAYLDPKSVNGLNLYAYCNNDPVNYADPSGHSPKWLQDLAIGLSIVGAILVTGAITALTMGVGTTIMVTSMAGAVIHGAAVGTLIGAGVGVVGGAIVGGAFTDWSVKGVLTGAGIGFGALAIAGALIGGAVGAVQYMNAVNSWGQVVSNGQTITSKENMIRHFNKHVVGEGHQYLGNNVINYTRNANKFKNTISAFKTLESGSLSARGVYLGNKVSVIIDPLSKLLLSFC